MTDKVTQDHFSHLSIFVQELKSGGAMTFVEMAQVADCYDTDETLHALAHHVLEHASKLSQRSTFRRDELIQMANSVLEVLNAQ